MHWSFQLTVTFMVETTLLVSGGANTIQWAQSVFLKRLKGHLPLGVDRRGRCELERACQARKRKELQMIEVRQVRDRKELGRPMLKER